MTRREEIQQRLEAATKGDWWAGGEGVIWAQGFWGDGEGRLEVADCGAPSYPQMGVEPLTEMMANAEFIAHAPEDVRWLLDQLDEHDEKVRSAASTAADFASYGGTYRHPLDMD